MSSVPNAVTGMVDPMLTLNGGDPAGLDDDKAVFLDKFDREPFYVTRNLAPHPLMQLSAIAALSERLPKNSLEWGTPKSINFTDPEKAEPVKISCPEAIRQIENRPAWIALLQVEHDEIYKRLIDEILEGVQTLSERQRSGMWQHQAFTFVSSNSAVTPYHFDPEYNFLLQARGPKTVYMRDPDNQAVLAEPDVVHFPLHAPHMVKTQSDISISMNVTFRSRKSQAHAMVRGANAHLRHRGLSPPSPGRSPAWDIAASFGYRDIHKTAAMAERVIGRSS